MPELYFEDFKVGTVFELGTVEMSRERIVSFAREFDPQPFHIDPEAAARSPFGGLIASGWHTCAAFMRLFVEGVLSKAASLGSPGVEELRWLKPVRPGDVLRARYTVQGADPSRSRADRGTVTSLAEVFNQDGVLVMTVKARNLISRRPT
ncbi:MAG: MaoC family dehydratase [Myxococcales bacterium]